MADMADNGETELSHAVTLQMPLIAARTADGDADRDRSHFNEFAEHALPDGTLIEGFRIVRSIGEGGFGIVYLAWDVALERHVAIKEYMPTSLAVRANPSLEVSMRSDRHRGTFDAGLKSFVNEARLLARFDHPALVKVFRFWEANRTAYMAMPFYEGPTLKATLATASSAPSESQIRAWLEPLLDALSVLHREHCYHRDISPDNILLTTAGPVLLDFGAARRVISGMTQVLTAVLKPGFAPIEQYGGELQQGPWTDLYALAGVVHYAITGRAPTASVVRVVSDTLRPLAMTQAGNYSDNFLRAIDIALSVRPEARPQDVAQFRALLDVEKARPVTLVPATPDHAIARSTDALGVERTAPDSNHRIGQVERQSSADAAPVSEPVVQLARPSARRSHRSIYVAAACLLVAGSTIWWSRQGSDPRCLTLSRPHPHLRHPPLPHPHWPPQRQRPRLWQSSCHRLRHLPFLHPLLLPLLLPLRPHTSRLWRRRSLPKPRRCDRPFQSQPSARRQQRSSPRSMNPARPRALKSSPNPHCFAKPQRGPRVAPTSSKNLHSTP